MSNINDKSSPDQTCGGFRTLMTGTRCFTATPTKKLKLIQKNK